MDLRGRGRSEQPYSGYDIDHHCRDIEILLGSLGLNSIVLMGHSLGAYIATNYAVKHPDQVERMILVDGGAKLSDEQTQKVLDGIKGSLDRLGKVFPSFHEYRESMAKAPFLQPWLPSMNTFFQHELEILPEGVRSRIQASTIEEELTNLLEFDISSLYSQVQCPVLILRAKMGMLNHDDILLPDDVLGNMLMQIRDSRCVNVEGTNHYTILFQENEMRDQAIHAFLADQRDSGKITKSA